MENFKNNILIPQKHKELKVPENKNLIFDIGENGSIHKQGGNIRGKNAVDLQHIKNNNNVASGDNSTISGGENNRASGKFSVITGGKDNVVSKSNSVALGNYCHNKHENSILIGVGNIRNKIKSINHNALRLSMGINNPIQLENMEFKSIVENISDTNEIIITDLSNKYHAAEIKIEGIYSDVNSENIEKYSSSFFINRNVKTLTEPSEFTTKYTNNFSYFNNSRVTVTNDTSKVVLKLTPSSHGNTQYSLHITTIYHKL